MLPLARWRRRFAQWLAERRLRRRAREALDELFANRPDLLRQARLAPRHRHRLNVLEVEPDSGDGVRAVRFGIVRHPRPHPLAPRGDEVLEIVEYRPAEERLRVIAARNLTRSREQPER